MKVLRGGGDAGTTLDSSTEPESRAVGARGWEGWLPGDRVSAGEEGQVPGTEGGRAGWGGALPNTVNALDAPNWTPNDG